MIFREEEQQLLHLAASFINMAKTVADTLDMDISPALNVRSVTLKYVRGYRVHFSKNGKLTYFEWINPADIPCFGFVYIKGVPFFSRLFNNSQIAFSDNLNFLPAVLEIFYCFQKILCGKIVISLEAENIKGHSPDYLFRSFLSDGIYEIFFKSIMPIDEYHKNLEVKKHARFFNT